MANRRRKRKNTMAEQHFVELTIVLPCLGEERTVAVGVEKAHGAIDRIEITGEVLVADDGSTDASQGDRNTGRIT
jgi:hypothetical protein